MKLVPKLSIVTVVYNDLDALKDTVESVSELNLDGYEHIIIDGGSTDGTKEYIESLDRSFLRYSSEPDEGIFDAFNKGIRMSRGEWVHLLNAGDLYANKNVFSDINFSTTKDFMCFPVYLKRKSPFTRYPKLAHDIFIDVGHPGLLVKRDYYTLAGMYSIEYKFVSDSHFIWNHVKPDKSIIYKKTLVHMEDGGYSTVLRLQHELEKHHLIFFSRIPVVDKIKLHFKYLIYGVYRFITGY